MSKLQLPVIITPTRAELGARCHRRHFLADILSKARYFSPSLEFGSVVHAGAAAHWLNVKQPVVDEDSLAIIETETWRPIVQSEWSKRKIESESMTLKLAESMLEHYVQNAQLAGPFTEQGNWQLVDVEQRFELPLMDTKLSFQCDRVVYDKAQNWMVIVDSKTAARLDSKWDRQWETSLQMKLYRAGAKHVFQTGGRIDVVIEGILKHVPSAIRYYVCPEWSDSLLKEAIHNAWLIASMDKDLVEQSCDAVTLRDAQDNVITKQVPNEEKALALAVALTPVNYFDCYSYGIECPFRRICVADVDERVAIVKGEYFNVEGEY